MLNASRGQRLTIQPNLKNSGSGTSCLVLLVRKVGEWQLLIVETGIGLRERGEGHAYSIQNITLQYNSIKSRNKNLAP